MTSREYLILGYAIALGLMWGHALMVWLKWRKLAAPAPGAGAPGSDSRAKVPNSN